ncbi:ankyrin repeat domain-containing protein 61 [Poecilia latipinna]|uniref:ankyrin repeat domain-containing protein 61 n=1 Tax=Poecilia latipinna TaxID=48699 RepID=UPI00072E2A64|nr:PREDICTED: ankyrin repeat domain-containing protein 61 [Poecilia latipinna]
MEVLKKTLDGVSLKSSTMSKDQSRDKRDKVINIYRNEFYTAVLDEDVRGIENMVKKYGSNNQIEIQDGSSRGVFWKGFAILPLHLAATYRRVHSLQSLLSAGADVQVKDKLGRTSLHLVIINWPITTTKPSSKFWAAVARASRQAKACLRLLCEHGADVNTQMDDQSQQTPLHLSVRYRALSAVRLLISCGANVNAVDSSGMTPLHMAASILHQDIASSLISHGADVNMRMHHSANTPLHLAAVAVMTKATKVLDEDVSCVSELLERGAKPNIVNEAGMSPFHQTCSLGNEQLVDLLLRYRASVNKLSAAGQSCLFLFLNHTPNTRNGSLLIKLLTLSTPLSVCSHDGRLPSTLTQPRFFKQREQLIQLTQQPKTLCDICKSNIYLKHIRGRKEELKKVIPESLYNFVFNQWEIQNLPFVTESEEAS